MEAGETVPSRDSGMTTPVLTPKLLEQMTRRSHLSQYAVPQPGEIIHVGSNSEGLFSPHSQDGSSGGSSFRRQSTGTNTRYGLERRRSGVANFLVHTKPPATIQQNVFKADVQPPLDIRPHEMAKAEISLCQVPSNVRVQFNDIMRLAETHELLTSLFWFIYCYNFQPVSHVEQNILFDEIARWSVKVRTALMRLVVVEKLAHFLPYIYAHAVNAALYLHFPGSRSMLTRKLRTDVYRVVFFMFNGIDLSHDTHMVTRAKLYPSDRDVLSAAAAASPTAATSPTGDRPSSRGSMPSVDTVNSNPGSINSTRASLSGKEMLSARGGAQSADMLARSGSMRQRDGRRTSVQQTIPIPDSQTLPLKFRGPPREAKLYLRGSLKYKINAFATSPLIKQSLAEEAGALEHRRHFVSQTPPPHLRIERVDEKRETYKNVFMQLLNESRSAAVVQDYKRQSKAIQHELKQRKAELHAEHWRLDQQRQEVDCYDRIHLRNFITQLIKAQTTNSFEQADDDAQFANVDFTTSTPRSRYSSFSGSTGLSGGTGVSGGTASTDMRRESSVYSVGSGSTGTGRTRSVSSVSQLTQ
eukprot:TRINITY_DN1245_c0_g1_i1.p1 TRINITY_DN1245_c0_g1~~TRINITY_DN1245_c0_g1_i1.p1  ORF type:complete len:583 (+),score=110.23 TRINITY_DN1245_c0_g1_i1:127-1875(+)